MEYRKRCTVCGKIYCFTDEDIKANNRNSLVSGLAAIGSIAAVFGGTRYDAYEQSKLADRNSSKIIDFSKCPNCNSTNVVDISEEEWAQLQEQPTVPVGRSVEINSNATAESLIVRVQMFIEEENWQMANTYCEQILDIDPTNGEVFYLKMLIENKFKGEKDIIQNRYSMHTSKFYNNMERFANDSLREKLAGIEAAIAEDIEQEKNRQYNSAVIQQGKATTIFTFESAIEQFRKLNGYKDSEARIADCKTAIQNIKNEEKYNQANKNLELGTLDALMSAQREFRQLGSYKDAKDKKEVCDNSIAELQAQQKRRTRMAIAIVTPILCVLIALAMVITLVIIPAKQNSDAYKAAEELLAAEDYNGAISAFSALGDYKDSAERAAEAEAAKQESINAAAYANAEETLRRKNYDEAISAFDKLGDYKDSAERVLEIKYSKADALLNNADYDGAIAIFEELGDFKDSAERVEEVIETKNDSAYNDAVQLLEKDDYISAVKAFDNLGTYRDSAAKADEFRPIVEMLQAMEEDLEEGYNLLKDLPVHYEKADELASLCELFIPYCGEYQNETATTRMRFTSVFLIRDGRVLWTYKSTHNFAITLTDYDDKKIHSFFESPMLVDIENMCVSESFNYQQNTYRYTMSFGSDGLMLTSPSGKTALFEKES